MGRSMMGCSAPRLMGNEITSCLNAYDRPHAIAFRIHKTGFKVNMYSVKI